LPTAYRPIRARWVLPEHLVTWQKADRGPSIVDSVGEWGQSTTRS